MIPARRTTTTRRNRDRGLRRERTKDEDERWRQVFCHSSLDGWHRLSSLCAQPEGEGLTFKSPGQSDPLGERRPGYWSNRNPSPTGAPGISKPVTLSSTARIMRGNPDAALTILRSA